MKSYHVIRNNDLTLFISGAFLHPQPTYHEKNHGIQKLEETIKMTR